MPRLEDELGPVGGDRRGVGHERRLAVGEDEVGLEGEPGQARTDGGDRPEGAGHDLPVAAPGLGTGHGHHLGQTHLGPRRVGYRAAGHDAGCAISWRTAAW